MMCFPSPPVATPSVPGGAILGEYWAGGQSRNAFPAMLESIVATMPIEAPASRDGSTGKILPHGLPPHPANAGDAKPAEAADPDAIERRPRDEARPGTLREIAGPVQPGLVAVDLPPHPVPLPTAAADRGGPEPRSPALARAERRDLLLSRSGPVPRPVATPSASPRAAHVATTPYAAHEAAVARIVTQTAAITPLGAPGEFAPRRVPDAPASASTIRTIRVSEAGIRPSANPVTAELARLLETNGTEPQGKGLGIAAFAAAPSPDVAATGWFGLPAPASSPAAASQALAPSLQPFDFATLVDRLALAREGLDGAPLAASLAHPEFGAVTLSFEHTDRDLSVTATSPDPDFAPVAIAAAALKADFADRTADPRAPAIAQPMSRELGPQTGSSRDPDTHPQRHARPMGTPALAAETRERSEAVRRGRGIFA